MRLAAPFLACLPTLTVLAAPAPEPPRVAIPRLAQNPSMAWDADLSSWKDMLVIQEFGMIMPDDRGKNRWPTTVRLGWGTDALYVAFEARDPEPEKIHAARHMRDTNSGDFDFVGLDLDPTGKGQSILRFFVTPLGGQIDEIATESTGENDTYNCLWDSTGVRTPEGYVVKMRIPYTSLRRSPGDWYLRLLRIIPRERRYGISWPRMSRDIQCDYCQMARATEAPVEKPGSPFLFIPFISASRSQSLEADPAAPPRTETRLGFDLRYASRAFTLEGTYQPDFATADADVDPLQINSRFKVFYPERRNFFLEGMDLLGIQGAQRQFFSRTIQDPRYGVKASGQASALSWTALHAQDLDGGLMLEGSGAEGLAGLSTRDTAAALKFRTDGRGSGLSLLGTDKRLVGGPEAAGGQSGGLYLDQYLGPDFRFVGSLLQANSRLPQADGQIRSLQGTATSAELDWNTRNWSAYALSQATSPDLVLVSGFTDLQGYRRQQGGFTWKENWNEGRLSSANATLRGRRLDWWNGDPMDRVVGLDAWIETAGRLSFFANWDIAGRSWAGHQGPSVATRGLTLGGNWRYHAPFQLGWNATRARTLDLKTGDPARFQSGALFLYGTVDSLSYNLTAQQAGLDRESDGIRLIRARELTLSGSYQFPRAFYLKTQGFIVRYDGRDPDRVDKYLKVFAGWQPNAFTQAYLGWSGQRRLDPPGIPAERMTERGLFAKFAYAFQF